MCGILGSINLSFNHDALDLISSRGPDDSGIYQKQVGHHSVFFGHRRLSIVDLSDAGHQPMVDTSGNYALCYNGEVYNHSLLRSDLRETHFKGHSDTETILYHLIENGIGRVTDLNGIFAFSYLDSHNQKLFLVRDPFGIKPLYYKVSGSSFVFCSEIKPILKLMNDQVSKDNLSELLTLRYSASPNTLFKGIKKLRPGHVLEIDLNGESISYNESSYLNYTNKVLNISFNEAVEEYGRLFSQSIQRQLMSDVDIGVLLSGGVDSALVAKYAADLSPGRLKAFTVGFDKKGFADETLEAKESSDIIGMDYYDTSISYDDFLSTINTCVDIVEEPSATTSIVPMFYLSKLAADNVKVVMSGQGADEPLGGYRRYQGELYKKLLPPKLISAILPIAKKLGVTNEVVLRGLSSLSKTDDVSRFLASSRVFEEGEINSLIGSHNNKSSIKIDYFYKLLECASKPDSVDRLMSIDLRMNLADDLLLYTDKITMHHSLECRVPMLDNDLIRFIESLPSEYKLKFRQGKIIHKAFAKRVLPDNIVNRKKKGFLSPTNEWFKRKDILADLLLNNNSKFSTIFDVSEVEKIIDQHINGYNRERHIFLLLSTYFWLEKYG